VHGGSLRVYVTTAPAAAATVDAWLERERESGLCGIERYLQFGQRVDGLRTAIHESLYALRDDGLRLAAYGAAAKATTLLSACGIGVGVLDYVVDLNPFKHGKYMPGIRLPVRPVTALRETPADVLVILAWNFADEIMGQQQEFRRNGGRFLIPIPEPRLIPA